MRNFVSRRLSKAQVSATSLIFTIFGDTVSVHGGSIWLTSVIDAMERFGINERLVRTSVYRLVKDGLLESERIGRCSYYRFSDAGKKFSARASSRIYASQAECTETNWLLALVGRAHGPASELRRGLQWLGFQALRPGLYAHPAGDKQALKQMLTEQSTDDVVIFDAEPGGLGSERPLRELVYEKWSLESMAKHYREFCRVYRPQVKKLARGAFSAEDAFLLRTMMIHEYRRVLLKDPQLPDAMLPGDWEGNAAHDIAARIYRAAGPIAVEFIRDRLENASGALPAPNARFEARFGGLLT